MSKLRKVVFILGTIVLIVAGLEFALLRHLQKVISNSTKEEPIDPKDLLLSANDIRFESEDGVDLRGWLILGRANYPAIVFAHDYQSDRSETLSKLEGLITTLNKEGYFIFLFDFRGHGESGSRTALGFHENRDLAGALKAVLRYKQIARRIAVVGIGMGAIAAADSLDAIDEVKMVVFDSIYESIPSRSSEEILDELPFLTFTRPLLVRAVGLNLQRIVPVSSVDLRLQLKMAMLYPKAVLFVEKKPLRAEVKTLYDAAKEPKEILQMDQTAAGELIGEDRQQYNSQLIEKIHQLLPPISNQKTLEIPR